MKILLFSDLHAHNHEQFSKRLPNGRNSRFQDCLNIIYQARDLVISRKIQSVLFLGDLFHSRVKLDIDVLTSTAEAMLALRQVVPESFVVLAGNHDQYTKVGDIHSLDILDKSIKVVSEPETMCLDGKTVVFFHPYCSDLDALKSRMAAKGNYDLCCFHQGIAEASIGPYDSHIRCELHLADLPLDRARFCIAGDFHKRQFLADGKFHYLGSPLQLTFAERGDEKCFSLIDTDTWTVESIPTEAPKFYWYDTPKQFEDALSSIRLDKDFIRVSVQSRKEYDFTKAKYPTVDCCYSEPLRTVTRRTSVAMDSDKDLIRHYSNSQKTDFDVCELAELGWSILQGASEC